MSSILLIQSWMGRQPSPTMRMRVVCLLGWKKQEPEGAKLLIIIWDGYLPLGFIYIRRRNKLLC